MSNAAAFLRAKFKYGAKAVEAAKQMRRHVMLGKAFEIPATQSQDDLTTKSVLCLQELWPDTPVIFQSRGWIIGMVEQTMKVSKEAWGELKKAGYFPPAEAAKNAEAFLTKHEQFVTAQNGQDIELNIKEGQRRQAARDAIVVGAASAPTKLVEAEKPVAFEGGRTFAEVEAENEKARAAELEKKKGVEL